MSFPRLTRRVKLAVIRKQEWVSLNQIMPNKTALLAYKGKNENLGQDSDLRFVLKTSCWQYPGSADLEVYSEEGATNLQIALGKYQNALEEFQARGTLDKRIIGVELKLKEERGQKWTAMIAHVGKTLLFVVEWSTTSGPFASQKTESYSEEEAKTLQHALGKYQSALEALRSTGKVPGWLVESQFDRLLGGANVGGNRGAIFGALVGGIGGAIIGTIFAGIFGASGGVIGVIFGAILGAIGSGMFGASAGVMFGGFVGANCGLCW